MDIPCQGDSLLVNASGVSRRYSISRSSPRGGIPAQLWCHITETQQTRACHSFLGTQR